LSSLIRVAITGVSGRMGALLVQLVQASPAFVLVGGTDKPGSSSIGLDVGLAARVGLTEVTTLDSLERCFENKPHVVIDFTTPEASVLHAQACALRQIPLVVGSTGFSERARQEMTEMSKRIPVVMSPNMSIGVNLVIELAAQFAKRLGPGFDIEVVETHHRLKKDAPSGTALRLADELARARGMPSEAICLSRVGQAGERPENQIGVQTVRGGDVVGEHTVHFLGDGERIELTHRATSREQFGRGALRAAQWIVGKPPGLFSMADVSK
jgi:4-hydroxy-tetrahydrodipicolinate reductase